MNIGKRCRKIDSPVLDKPSLIRMLQTPTFVNTKAADIIKFGSIHQQIVDLGCSLSNLRTCLGSHVIIVVLHQTDLV